MSTNTIIRGGISNAMVRNMCLRYLPGRNGGRKVGGYFREDVGDVVV
jgi:hypothetical protein